MKKLLPVIAFFTMATARAQKPPVKSAAPAPTQKLNGRTDSLQYTLGAFVGLFITNNGFPLKTASPVFLRGLEDILQNRTRPFPDSMISENIRYFQQVLQRENAVQLEQQMFAALKDKPGIGTFPNGVKYSILQTGKGPRASETDSITVHLQAKLADGTVVEDTYQSQKPFEATSTAFFPGLTDALQMMTEGSKWRVFVPSALAYGEKGTTLIPPNSALIIEVELLQVRKK